MNDKIERAARTMRIWGAFALAVLLAVGCAKDPAPVSVSATTHNYSQDDVLHLQVDGKTAGSLADPAKPGKVTGGGVLCCIDLLPAKQTVEVEIKLVDMKGVVSTNTVQARVRQPWPETASYAIFNVLPGQRVLVEIVPSYLIPSGERLDELNQAWREAE